MNKHANVVSDLPGLTCEIHVSACTPVNEAAVPSDGTGLLSFDNAKRWLSSRPLRRALRTPSIVADTNTRLTVEQMAEAFRQLGHPVGEDEAISVDPDDWPLM